MSSIRWTLVLAALFAYIAVTTEACSCMQAHKQNHFCRADFVIKASVKGEEIIYKKEIQVSYMPSGENNTDSTQSVVRHPVSRKYYIRINRVFKDSGANLKNVSRGYIYTRYYDSMCGIHLQSKTKYLLTGFISNGELHTGLCSWIQPWAGLTNKQKQGISHRYKKNCNCTVTQCWGPRGCALVEFDTPSEEGNLTSTLTTPSEEGNMTSTLTKPNGCKWDTWKDTAGCMDKQAICGSQKDGGCQWRSNKMLTFCLREEKIRRRQEP